nr:hypothetical protein [Bacillus sp. RAR_GA_16]
MAKRKGEVELKSTAIVSKIDDLGRLVIQVELRRTLGVKVKYPLEIFVEEDRIILQNLVRYPTKNGDKLLTITNPSTRKVWWMDYVKTVKGMFDRFKSALC